eukprot:scaffold67801_cov55-Phaeocystis_antarctica.AAC.2
MPLTNNGRPSSSRAVLSQPSPSHPTARELCQPSVAPRPSGKLERPRQWLRAQGAGLSTRSAELPCTTWCVLRRHRSRAGALPRRHFDHAVLALSRARWSSSLEAALAMRWLPAVWLSLRRKTADLTPPAVRISSWTAWPR